MIGKLLKNKNTRLLLISVILGLVAALLVRSYVAETVFQRTGGKVVPIVVAKTEIPTGTVINADQLTSVAIPEAYLQARTVRVQDQSFLVGQRPSVDLMPGEAIQWPEIQLAPDQTLADRLRVDQRAVTIRVDQSGSLDGMIQPGDRVDVVCQVRSNGAGSVMHVVAQNMTIIAVNNRLTATASGGVGDKKNDTVSNNVSSVTFRASLQESMLLSYAESQGRMTLLLRNDKDVLEAPEKDIGSADLLGPVAQTSNTPPPDAPDYPTIYEPGQKPRIGNLPGAGYLDEELKKLKPEDAEKRIIQELQKPSPTP
jgi:pilus assembly protein CpaB